MSVRRVVIVECDRCGRKEELPPNQAPEERGKDQPAVTIQMRGQEEIKFGDLCARCTTRINNVVAALKNARGSKKEGEA